MGGYDDEFEDVMRYVEMQLNSQGERVKIRNKSDLRVLMERLDDGRKDQEGQPRFTNGFINSILGSKKADSFLGRTLGRFGRVREIQGTSAETTTTVPRQEKLSTKAIELKASGKEVYSYEKGHAQKVSYKQRGKTVIRFKDVDTGKFLSKKNNYRFQET